MNNYSMTLNVFSLSELLSLLDSMLSLSDLISSLLIILLFGKVLVFSAKLHTIFGASLLHSVHYFISIKRIVMRIYR